MRAWFSQPRSHFLCPLLAACPHLGRTRFRLHRPTPATAACDAQPTAGYLNRPFAQPILSCARDTLAYPTDNNMARKLVETSSGSSLSPRPANLTSVATDPAPTAEITPSGKKRKVVAVEQPAVKRTKQAQIKAKENPTCDKTTAEDRGEEVQAKKVVKRKIPVRKKLGPLAERTTDSRLRVGAHVSAAGGVHNALANLVHIGGNAFSLFLKNHRRWDNTELDPAIARLFLDGCKEHSINAAETCVPHGSYLVNLAHPDADRKAQAYASFVNDLHRCHRLGIRLYNFHPGNANAGTREQGIQTIAQHLNQAHQDPASGNVITLLETMATQGNTIGGILADLAAIIALVEDKSRVGVCLDTCHVFAAGYDLRSQAAYEATMHAFDQTIGLAYLKALHVNDSKAPLSSNRDLHARIGTGYLGLRAFHNLVNDARVWGLPMVLETPCEVVGADGSTTEDKGVWAREIKLLESLVGMDADGDEFRALEAGLQAEGLAERERIGGQVERRAAKKGKNGTRVPAKGKGKAMGKAEVERGDEVEDE